MGDGIGNGDGLDLNCMFIVSSVCNSGGLVGVLSFRNVE